MPQPETTVPESTGGGEPTPALWRARKSGDDGFVGRGRPEDERTRDRDADPDEDRRLRCRACGAAVTSPEERISVAGSHVHRRTNPAGFEFEFGCFSDAAGAEVSGRPSAEFSWFAGYRWSYSTCRRCGAHLGWFFEGTEPHFHGLILDRLAEDDRKPPAP